MKIAIATENENVCQHFGRCELYTLVDIQNGSIAAKTMLDTSAHQHGAMAGFLKQNGVEVVICGGIGGGALESMAKQNIAVINGISGTVGAAVVSYIAGNLKPADAANCSHDHDGHECTCH